MPWQIERKGHVAVVTLDTNAVNAQNEAFFSDLLRAFDRLESELADCSVVLTGNARAFSAGLDFEEVFSLFGSRDRARIQQWFERYRATNLRIFQYPRPTVAAINGPAIAGGLITALNCDWRIGKSEENKYGLNEVPIGIPMPATYLEIVKHAVGSRSASALALFGSIHSTSEALALGVLHQVTPHAQLLDAAIAQASKITPDSFGAYAFSKRALQAPVMRTIDALYEQHDAQIAETICNQGSIRALAHQYQRLKGALPPWALT